MLYHRQITPLHLFLARYGIEFMGISLAFVVITFLLNAVGLMSPPKDLLPIFGGWLLLTWMTFGIATIMGALGEIFEFIERFVQVMTYILLPLSGSFYMAAWVPPLFRHWVLFIPFIHCLEIIRGGFFGEFVKTYFDVPYAVACAAGMSLVGLVAIQFVRGRVEVD